MGLDYNYTRVVDQNHHLVAEEEVSKEKTKNHLILSHRI